MEKMRLGRTNLTPCRTGFGALPIQRLTIPDAVELLQNAYEGGINFFDSARGYSDSEEKLGIALEGVRKNVFIATKTHAHTRDQALRDLETSLVKLKTDYIDIGQMHNPSAVPDPEDKNSAYAAFREMHEQGVIHFIGMSQHKLSTAREAVSTGLFDTIQFPLSALSTEDEQKFIIECKQADVGVIAMKALSGGLITNAATSFAFLRQFDNLIPIWGVQRQSELEQLLSFEENPPKLDEAMWELILKDREQLSGAFCRACGYCSPCPADIPIGTAARMSLLLRRSPYQNWITPQWQANMQKIKNCINCGGCKSRCPYGLDTPSLLKENLAYYKQFCAEHGITIE